MTPPLLTGQPCGVNTALPPSQRGAMGQPEYCWWNYLFMIPCAILIGLLLALPLFASEMIDRVRDWWWRRHVRIS